MLIGIQELFSKLIANPEIVVNKRKMILREVIEVLSELVINTVSSAYWCIIIALRNLEEI